MDVKFNFKNGTFVEIGDDGRVFLSCLSNKTGNNIELFLPLNILQNAVNNVNKPIEFFQPESTTVKHKLVATTTKIRYDILDIVFFIDNSEFDEFLRFINREEIDTKPFSVFAEYIETMNFGVLDDSN